MPSSSKTKGNAFERSVAKTLSAWWGEDFKRTPNSGALRWNGATFAYGDLLPPESFPGIVETKHYREVCVSSLLRLGPSPDRLLGWWHEVLVDAGRCLQETGARMAPILVFRANGWRDSWICISAELWVDLLGLVEVTPPYLLLSRPDADCAMMQLDDFLQAVSREHFLQAVSP